MHKTLGLLLLHHDAEDMDPFTQSIGDLCQVYSERLKLEAKWTLEETLIKTSCSLQ